MYEYQCERCDQSFTLLQSVHVRSGETICPHCGTKKIQRLFSTFASKVEGSGGPAPAGGSHGCGSGGCGCA
ncbi:MAG TPA: zinc ribbon domain-containing protein [Nitrospiria bacterium]|nr:zinc ribbon domain-containing protein [Nitrospiria bacterium]